MEDLRPDKTWAKVMVIGTLELAIFGALHISLGWVRDKAMEAAWRGMVADAFSSRQATYQYRMLAEALNLRKPDQAPMDELTRKQKIMAMLRNDYIIHHEHVSPGLLAGIEPPPVDWTNKRLRELGQNWTVTASEPPKPLIVGAARAPEEPKAQIEFSFYTDNPDELPIQETTLPVTDYSVDVQLTYRVTGEVSAKSGHVWLRICNQCSYLTEPADFRTIKGKPTDRERDLPPILVPNALAEKIEFKLMLPIIPRSKPKSTDIGCAYACDNCPVLDPKKPQRLTINLQWNKLTGRVAHANASSEPSP